MQTLGPHVTRLKAGGPQLSAVRAALNFRLVPASKTKADLSGIKAEGEQTCTDLCRLWLRRYWYSVCERKDIGEEKVQETFLKSGWETTLVAIPFIGLLFLAVFGLDAVIGASKKKGKHRKPASGLDKDGTGLYADPDGRRWKERRKVKRPE